MIDDGDVTTQDDRDRAFARSYVELRALKNPNAAEIACVRSGITDPEYNMRIVAERQLSRVSVQRLIREFEESFGGIERREYSRDFFLDELQLVHQKALDAKSFASAITAIKTQAQLLGMMEQTVNVNHSVSAKDLDLETLRAMVAREMIESGGPALIEGEFRVIDGSET